MSDPRGPAYWGRHDYAPCTRCGVLRPLSEMAWLPTYGHHCTDVAWCSRQAGTSEGASGLDSHGNALPPESDGKPPDAP